MNILIGILLIIYGFSVFNTGLKEEFNLKLGLKFRDQDGQIHILPKLLVRENLDEKLK